MTCPVIMPSGNPCVITVRHWHYPAWAVRVDWSAMMMLDVWWPQRRPLNRGGRESP